MNVKELEKENAAPVVKHPPAEELKKAADQHFDSVEYVNPPPPQSKAGAEAEGEE